MPASPDHPSTFELAEAQALGLLKEDQVQALDHLLRSDPEARERYVLAIEIMSLVHEEVRRREEAEEMYVAEPLLKDYDEIFAELLRMERSANAIMAREEEPRRKSGIDFGGAVGALRSVAARPVVWGPIAAVLLVAVSLYFAFSDEAVDQTMSSNVVATLTAEHDAVWDRRPGEDLFAGQRFTLTQGLAEITTNRSAIAVIEAPATIELINDNAIRLHAGKLVGICETESSKGFLVRTPHMDITDMGTRFGVDATQTDATSVHVLQGEVEVVGVSASGETAKEPKRLTAGHAMASDPSDGLMSVAFEQSSFTQDLEHLSYRPEVQGHDAIWQGQASGDLSLNARQADAVQVFIERKGVRLERDTAVDLAGDRVWSKGSVPGQHTVAAGSRVDVYLLHLDPMRKQSIRGDYTVRFDRPILGVIAHQDTLVATDAALGAPGTTYPVITDRHTTVLNVSIEPQRGLDIAMSDRAAITDDAAVLHVKSNAASVSDQVRVLVRAIEE